MASRYDELDAATQLEQRLAADLKQAFEPRGCRVVHNGTNAGGRHAPGGKPDIEIFDDLNRRRILVEVTRRRGSAADGEFLAVTDHLDRAIAQGGYEDYGLLYISPRTSARMSTNFRDLYNRMRERSGQHGRVVALDFEATQLLIDKLATAEPALYPASRLGELFARWADGVDDARSRQLVQRTLFPEDLALSLELAEEAQEFDASREKELKKGLLKIENDFRSHGITGNNANSTLVYLAFVRLFEERRQRRTGRPNRFTLDGFRAWCEALPAAMRATYQGRLVEALLHELAEAPELVEAGLLQRTAGQKPTFHPRLTDDLVEAQVLPLFDQYDFHAGRVDVLGAVFETLAGRAEKDTQIGQFFTPQQVVDFAADLVDLRPTDVVADPAVGTARFLIAAMDRLLDNADEVNGVQADVEASIRRRQLLGADIDDWVATIAKMNMFIHGDGKSGISAVNGLILADREVFQSYPNGMAGMADVVLTNPPLGDTDYTVAERAWESLGGPAAQAAGFYDSLGVVPMEVREETEIAATMARKAAVEARIFDLEAMEAAERPRNALSRARKSRDAYASRILDLQAAVKAGDVTRVPRGQHLKGGALFLGAISQYLRAVRLPEELYEWQGGRCAIVVDEAILNTPEYAQVRAFIRRKFFIKAVVSLSREAFKYLAHTDAKTSILFLIKKPDPNIVQREPIFFSHAERVGYGATGNWVGDDLPQVLVHYQVFKDEVRTQYQGRFLNEAAALGSAQRLSGHGRAFYARLDSGVGSGRLDFYDARFRQREAELESRYGALVPLGSVLEIAPMRSPEASRTGEYDFAVAARTGVIDYKGRQAVSYSPKELWVVEEGDLVLSSIDLVNGAVAVAGTDVAGLVMSKEMYSYRVKDEAQVVAEYLQILLRTQAAREMLLGFTTGTSNRTRLEDRNQLLNFPIPALPPVAEQRVKADELRVAYGMFRQAETRLRALDAEAELVLRPTSSRQVPTDVPQQPIAVAKALS